MEVMEFVMAGMLSISYLQITEVMVTLIRILKDYHYRNTIRNRMVTIKLLLKLDKWQKFLDDHTTKNIFVYPIRSESQSGYRVSTFGSETL